jgi:tetratricopeptide (TPR) repeat protein
MMRTLTTATLALALSLASPPPALASPADEAEYVRDVVGRAAAHVEAGRYEQALAELDRAERDRPLPVFVYVRATIEERRGDCERAVALYLRFLELDIPAKDADDARRGVERCQGDPEPTPPQPQEDPTPPDPPADPPADVAPAEPQPDPPPPRPWHTDPLGGVLLASGIAGLGVGLGLYGQSRTDERAAANATTLQAFDDRSRRAVALNQAGIATITIGSALMLGSVLRYALVGTRPRRRPTAFTPTGLRIRF